MNAPGLRSLKRSATELTRVRFPDAAYEAEKNPSRAIYEANMEVSAKFGKVDEKSLNERWVVIHARLLVGLKGFRE